MTSSRRRFSCWIVPLLLAVLAAGVGGCGSRTTGAGVEAEKQMYFCPMHPTYVSDRIGDCPICNMRLVPMQNPSAAEPPVCVCPVHHDITAGAAERCPKCGMAMVPNAECGPACDRVATVGVESPPAATRPAVVGGRVLFYRSPMNPSITSPVPTKDEMGMDFVAVYADAAAPVSSVPGLATVELSPAGLELAGVRTAEARREPFERTVRTVGMVVADERQIRHVQTKIAGWIEKLHVNFTGQVVRKNEPLLAIYSPELLASQDEYLRVRAAAARLAGSEVEEVRRGGEQLLVAARNRLRRFDVPAGFIDELERRGTSQRTVTLPAPAAGVVTTKSVFEGQQVEPGQVLFTVTDLSSVWIEADVYEFEAPLVKVGQEAQLDLPFDPSGSLSGRVTFVNPTLSQESRTLKVRFEFENPEGRLKPGMYADVALLVASGESVVVPDSAVMDTGTRQVMFVELGGGRFAPREVRVGLRSGGRAQVLDGLQAGERVVVHANFLLDSESRLRGAIAETTRAMTERESRAEAP